MKQKFTYEETQRKFFLESCKDLEATGAKRFSLNLPDCSAVLENQNNNNLMDTNEISWLQKFAQENQKICNSRLFDQNSTGNSRPLASSNDMKFSFNMNYHHEDRKKEENNSHNNEHQSSTYSKNAGRCQSPFMARDYSTKKITRQDDAQNILAEIQNTQQTATKRTRKDNLPGSIKKNSKSKLPPAQNISEYHRQIAEVMPSSKLDQMNQRLNKALHKDRSSYIEQITNKQNAKLFSDASIANLIPSSKIFLNNKSENVFKEHKRVRDIPSIPALQERAKITQFSEPPRQANIRYDHIPAIQTLFNKLDISQTGKLSKFNCSVSSIPEDFKFIFGSIITRIKYKQLSCNKRQFVKLCENIIKEVDSSELTDLLKEVVEKKEITTVSKQKVYDKNSKSPFKTSLYQEEPSWMNLDKKRVDNKKDIMESYPIKQTWRNNAIPENNCKCGSKIQSKVNELSNQYSRNFRQSSLNTKKSSQMVNPSLSKQYLFDQNLTFYPKKPITHQDSYEKNQTNEDSSRKRSVISESMIQDHRKSLENIKNLNQRMQFCLNTNMLSEHSKQGLSREDSLTFDVLIKHV